MSELVTRRDELLEERKTINKTHIDVLETHLALMAHRDNDPTLMDDHVDTSEQDPESTDEEEKVSKHSADESEEVKEKNNKNSSHDSDDDDPKGGGSGIAGPSSAGDSGPSGPSTSEPSVSHRNDIS